MATWLSQVKDSTGFLKRFYIGLRDPEQRDRAEAAGAFARERLRPSGRKFQNRPCPWVGLPSEMAERTAWVSAIHGLLGLNILVALGDSFSDGSKAGALHDRLNRELGIAVRGFAAAFPSGMVEGDLDALCERVIDEAADVADAAWRDVGKEKETRVNMRDFLRDEWLKDIKPGIRRMIDSA